VERSNDMLPERDRKSSAVPEEPWGRAPERPSSLRCCGEEEAYARASLALARAPGSSSFAAAACTSRARLGLLADRSDPWWLFGAAAAAGVGVGGRRLVGRISTTAE
jgi:hypothetical protein